MLIIIYVDNYQHIFYLKNTCVKNDCIRNFLASRIDSKALVFRLWAFALPYFECSVKLRKYFQNYFHVSLETFNTFCSL